MALYIIILIIAAALLAALIYIKSARYSVKVVYIKAAVSACFILTALVGTYKMATKDEDISLFPFFVIAGLMFGLLGDIWLDLKYAHKDETTSHTYAGFISFLTGHVFYIIGLIICYGRDDASLYIIIPAAAAIVIGVAIGISGKMMKLEYGRYKTIVMIYGAVLVGMTLISGALALLNGWQITTLNMMFAGGILFLISDLILSQMYFGEGHEYSAGFIAANLITYYAAQFVIASALFFG